TLLRSLGRLSPLAHASQQPVESDANQKAYPHPQDASDDIQEEEQRLIPARQRLAIGQLVSSMRYLAKTLSEIGIGSELKTDYEHQQYPPEGKLANQNENKKTNTDPATELIVLAGTTLS